MTADQLIDSLAERLVPVRPAAVGRRLLVFVAAGLAPSTLVFLFVLGVQPEFGQALATPTLYLKELFALALGTSGFFLARDAAIPGRRTRRPVGVVASILALAFMVASIQLARADPSALPRLLLGVSWTTCAPSIVMLSLPLLAALLLAIRGLAPTHLRIAGAGAGLCAGALATAIYALYCIETSPAFVALWYTLGIAMTTAAGAALGPRVLRW